MLSRPLPALYPPHDSAGFSSNIRSDIIILRENVKSCNVGIVMQNADTGRSWSDSFCRVNSVKCATRRKRSRKHLYRPHSHRAAQVFCVDSSAIEIELGSRRQTIGQGEYIILPPNKPHCIRGKGGKAAEFFNIIFTGRIPRGITGRVLQVSDMEYNILRMLKEEDGKRPPHYREAMRYLMSLFMLTVNRRLRQRTEAVLRQPNNRLRFRSQLVEHALRRLESDIERSLDARKFAASLGISDSHLRFLLKRETGHSLRQHLRRMRVERAKRMLRETPLNINEIARRVGYRSAPHFCAVFKRETGMTPGTYSKSLL